MKKRNRRAIAFLLASVIILGIVSTPAYAIDDSCVKQHFGMLNNYNNEDNTGEMGLTRTPPSEMSCAYTAISMILSFYDTYWNDNFVDDVYYDWDYGTYNSDTDVLLETFNASTEYFDWLNYQNADKSNYKDFVTAFDDDYLEEYLISLAKGCGLASDEDTIFGLDVEETVTILEYYLFDIRGFSENQVVVRCESTGLFGSSDEDLFEIMKNQIQAGYPVIYCGYNTTVNGYDLELFNSINVNKTGHVMVAYDTVGTDDNVTDIKLHTGWDGIMSFTTVNQTMYNSFNAVIWLEINENNLPHVCSNNYKDIATGEYICACQVYYQSHPKHDENHRYMYEDYDSTTHWLDCACGERGNIENHSYDNTYYDSNWHWLECDCGARTDTERHEFTFYNLNSDNHYMFCFDCEFQKFQAHSADEVVRLSDDQHRARCSCGEIYEEEHSRGYCEYNSLRNHNIYCECGQYLGREVHTPVNKLGKTYCSGCLYIIDDDDMGLVNGSKDDPDSLTE